MSARGLSSVIGVVAMVAVTVVLAATVAIMVGGLSMPGDPPDTRFTGEFDPAANEIAIRHAGGEPVTIDTVEIRVRVDGEPLAHQPPVPFFAAKGFTGGPTGPFNPASDGTWAAGDVGTFRIAGTNDPVPTGDSRVTVAVVLGGEVAATLELGQP